MAQRHRPLAHPHPGMIRIKRSAPHAAGARQKLSRCPTGRPAVGAASETAAAVAAAVRPRTPRQHGGSRAGGGGEVLNGRGTRRFGRCSKVLHAAGPARVCSGLQVQHLRGADGSGHRHHQHSSGDWSQPEWSAAAVKTGHYTTPQQTIQYTPTKGDWHFIRTSRA